MEFPDGRHLILDEGVLPEPGTVDGRVVLWLPGEDAGGYRRWERVGSVPRAEVASERGVRSVAATSTPARQRAGGGFGGLFRRPGKERAWTLPGGGEAEQCGPRRADVMLAWPEREASDLDPDGIRARWPRCEGIRAIGPRLYLVSGIDAPPPATPVGVPGDDAADSPLARAERALVEAKTSGDPGRCSVALADLGLASLQGRDVARGVGLMEEALAEARRAVDPRQETNAMIDLGVAALSAGRPVQAREVLERALARTRAAGDRFAELAALDRLGQACMASGGHADALGHFERALALAVALGDLPREADLLWHAAVQHAELGRRDRAIALARAAVDRMRRLGKPKAGWYAHHLDLFRAGRPGSPPHGRAEAPRSPTWDGLSMTIDTGSPGAIPTAEAGRGPGALQMALTAASSMAKFLGTGFKASPAETYRGRIEACATCEHHTGLRCRLCGCFTAAKARLLHERCPVARWRT